MSPDLREAKLGVVDQEAARQRAAVEYVIGIVEANEQELREVFVPVGTEEDRVPELLYAEVQRALKWTERHCTRTVGVTISHIRPGDVDLVSAQDPLVRLGWAKYYPSLPGVEDCVEGQTFPFVLHPTEAGRDLINGLRAAQGYETVEQTQERGRAAWDKAIADHNKSLETTEGE